MAVAFAPSTPATEVMNRRRAWFISENLYEVVSRAGLRRYRVRVVGGAPQSLSPEGTAFELQLSQARWFKAAWLRGER